jgi:hypothetical protein
LFLSFSSDEELAARSCFDFFGWEEGTISSSESDDDDEVARLRFRGLRWREIPSELSLYQYSIWIEPTRKIVA